eukprot:3124461-Rhodomonas_salina.1
MGIVIGGHGIGAGRGMHCVCVAAHGVCTITHRKAVRGPGVKERRYQVQLVPPSPISTDTDPISTDVESRVQGSGFRVQGLGGLYEDVDEPCRCTAR